MLRASLSRLAGSSFIRAIRQWFVRPPDARLDWVVLRVSAVSLVLLLLSSLLAHAPMDVVRSAISPFHTLSGIGHGVCEAVLPPLTRFILVCLLLSGTCRLVGGALAQRRKDLHGFLNGRTADALTLAMFNKTHKSRSHLIISCLLSLYLVIPALWILPPWWVSDAGLFRVLDTTARLVVVLPVFFGIMLVLIMAIIGTPVWLWHAWSKSSSSRATGKLAAMPAAFKEGFLAKASRLGFDPNDRKMIQAAIDDYEQARRRALDDAGALSRSTAEASGTNDLARRL